MRVDPLREKKGLTRLEAGPATNPGRSAAGVVWQNDVGNRIQGLRGFGGKHGQPKWVCFDCRETVRRAGYSAAPVLCPSCGQQCRCLLHRLRVPAKNQAKAWRELRLSLQQQREDIAEYKREVRMQRARELRAEIARLEAKGPNPGRAKQVRLLRRQLDKL